LLEYYTAKTALSPAFTGYKSVLLPFAAVHEWGMMALARLGVGDKGNGLPQVLALK